MCCERYRKWILRNVSNMLIEMGKKWNNMFNVHYSAEVAVFLKKYFKNINFSHWANSATSEILHFFSNLTVICETNKAENYTEHMDTNQKGIINISFCEISQKIILMGVKNCRQYIIRYECNMKNNNNNIAN